MQQNKSLLWTHIDKLPTEIPVHKLRLVKVGKQVHDIYIACYQDFLIRYRDLGFTHPHKMFVLNFATKFEVCRSPPKLKQDKQQVGKIKPEDIIQLGEILSVKLFRENVEQIYQLQGARDQIKQLRLFLGTRINQLGFHNMFRVSKKIGRGNFASVYLAERIEDNLKMAVKAFSKQTVYGEDKGREGLINEIQVMRTFDHPNIMTLYEVYETENSIYMGLELLEGDQLFEHVKKRVVFTNLQIQQILFGLLYGLRHMHQRGIMHRDLKLENILFKRPNDISSVVIADFGLAQHVSQTPYLYSRCGTPGFVAPEIINLKNQSAGYDSVCDIYSLGLIFYILLSGKPAFPGKSYNTIVRQNKESNISFAAPAFEVVSPTAKDLLFKMLLKDPESRIKGVDAIQHPYLQPVIKFENIKSTLNTNDDDFDIDDEAYISNDEDSDLINQIKKLNEESIKFDVLRIKQVNNSPIKSPLMTAQEYLRIDVDKLKLDDEDRMVMRTPVITGRVGSVENSPLHQLDISPFTTENRHVQQQLLYQGDILHKYSTKTKPQQDML